MGSHLGQFGYHCSEKSPWSFSKIFNIRASNCPPSSHVPTQTEDKSRISAVSLERGSGYGIVVRQPLEARAQVLERERSGGGQKHASHCLSEFCLLSSRCILCLFSPHHGNGASGHPLYIVKYFEIEVLCKRGFSCIYNQCGRMDGTASEVCEHHLQGR